MRMRKKSQMVSSYSGSPKRVLSQMSIHDLPNMYIISHDYDNDNLGEMLTESLIIGKQMCQMIIKKASNIILEKQILDQLIPYGWDYSCYLTNMIITDTQEDLNYVNFNNDEHEPQPCPIEHWRRMIGQILNPKPQITENRTTRRESKFQSVIEYKRKQSERIETLPVKTGELDEDMDFDTEIESMRQAKARQILTQQQKQMSDMIKLQESIEMNRQLKRLNVDSKSKYTYDFEGRVIVQKPPDVERYPKAYQDMQEKKVLIEVKDLYPNHKKQLETINNLKKKIQDNPTNFSVSSRYSSSQLEMIQLKQGVTFKEGKNEKKNERHLSLMDIKDPKDLQKTLSQMNLKMSKEEYSLITHTNLQSSFTSKQQTVQIQLSPLHQQGPPQPAPSINGDFSIQSLNSSILQKLNGTISILSDHLDELIVNDPLPNITPATTKLPQIPKPQFQAPHHLITEPTSMGLSNSLTKLPKALFVPGTFSRIIPKYPRERISKIARSFKQ